MSVPGKLYHLLKSGFIPSTARRSRWRALARQIIARSATLKNLSDEELLSAGRKIRWEAKAGVPLDRLLPEAYSLVREASRRVLGMQHFEVQIMGAIALFEGHIAEMQTGEGKTLTATKPSLLRALPGQGSHGITVNDYL
ncbi:MAG: translocase, partial [Planctomyces sp.]